MAGGADADHEYAFGVLGPLRVTRAGIPLSLGGRQQRAVLARLLLADDAGLTVDQLADALWAAAVPAGAAGTIQTYIFHLRRTLEPNRDRGRPGQVVITDQGRYRLAIGSDALDSAAFERRVDSGERMLADGALAEAVSDRDQALALWRGDVLADLADYDFVAPVATRLAERRKAAVEAKIDAELALGRHTSVLGQLNELVAKDPLNERLHGQRIVAFTGAVARPKPWRHTTSCATSCRRARRRSQPTTAEASPAGAGSRSGPGLESTVATPGGGSCRAKPESQARPAPAPPLRRRRPRLRPRWLVAGAMLVVAAAGIVTAVVVSQNPKHTLAALPPSSIGILDDDGALHDAVPVGQNFGSGRQRADDAVDRVPDRPDVGEVRCEPASSSARPASAARRQRAG